MRFILLLALIGCAPKTERRFDDDYVLIEFASKLEEESLKKAAQDGRPHDPHHNVSSDKSSEEERLPE